MSLLWKPESWSLRLAELEARTEDIKEAPLRRDVRSLGMLLGQVLREQAGEPLFAEVEELRQIAIQRREAQGESDAGQPFASGLESVHSLDLVQAYRLARAFAFYFELINLAETNHRKRRRLSLQPQLVPAAARLAAGDATRACERRDHREEALDCCVQIRIMPVFTAHPTEVARRVGDVQTQRIAELLEQLDRIPLSDEQTRAFSSDILTAEITALWQTDEVRCRRPTVRDEVTHGAGLLRGLHFRHAARPLCRDGRGTSRRSIDSAAESDRDADLLSFGSWIGGDRDGNPFVTPQVTREALPWPGNICSRTTSRRLQLILDQLTSSTQQAPV